ncbi:hypothetical protein OBBRIDRAFT_792100 [Obba rivulosa]|uniref:Peptidase S54 rhomboid domain-containing protein n=1 Tax=Obba rivulosa TaxID=1052685 RepID=A0A8E2AYT2_9APHY|nr:hypothetical protein OBBRIDRAFT_792100 [Obba rivulosa]
MFWTCSRTRLASPWQAHLARHLSRSPDRSFSPAATRRLPLPAQYGSLRTSPPSVVAQLTGAGGLKPFAERLEPPRVRRQVLFTILASVGVFCLAASETIDETIATEGSMRSLGGIWAVKQASSYELMVQRKRSFDQSLLAIMNYLHEAVESLPNFTAHQILMTYYQIAQPLVETSEGRRTCWTIGTISAAMFLLWKIPSMRPFLNRHFTHDPLSGKSYTMLTSLLSYKSFFHFALTSTTLASFGAITAHHFQQKRINNPDRYPIESTVKWELLAFIISAGLFGMLYTHVAALRFQYPRLISRLTSSAILERNALALQKVGAAPAKMAGPTSLRPLLGMSAAAYAALTYSILAFPDVSFDLFGLFPIPREWLFHACMLFDLVGVICAPLLGYWPRYWNHFAHMGGACFGAMYYQYGDAFWVYTRIAVLTVKIQWLTFWEAFQ